MPAGGSANGWAYVDVADLADLAALAAERSSPGHEIVYAAAADNIVGIPLADFAEAVDWPRPPALRPVDRRDTSGISCAKANRLFGWMPRQSWRDLEGKPIPDVGP